MDANRVCASPVLSTKDLKVRTEQEPTEIVARFLSVGEGVVAHWVEYARGLLLFVMAPGDDRSGEFYVYDRKKGNFWLLGRVDDVLNVAGHRIGTMEVESALVDHHSVAEAAVIGKTHEIKGQGISAFVTLKEGIQPSDKLKEELKNHVSTKIGSIAKPDDIFFTAELPKTRSAKIMRRLLRDIAEGRVLGDTTTLADPTVIAKLKEQAGDEG